MLDFLISAEESDAIPAETPLVRHPFHAPQPTGNGPILGSLSL